MMPYIISAIIILLLIYTFLTYNSLIKLRNRCDEAFSTMDIFLKKRWDLIPNLVEVVKGYANHEEKTLSEIVKLRSNVYDDMNINDKMSVNNNLSGEISRLMILVEAYPDLKANQNFIELSKELTKIEDDIANSRKYYNAVVRRMNDKVQMFPSNLIAKMFGFKVIEMFGVGEKERENVKIEI